MDLVDEEVELPVPPALLLPEVPVEPPLLPWPLLPPWPLMPPPSSERGLASLDPKLPPVLLPLCPLWRPERQALNSSENFR